MKINPGLLVTLVIFSITAHAESTSLQDISRATSPLPKVTIYTAREIVTLDTARPSAQAIAVVDDRILAVGTADRLKEIVGNQPYSVNTTFSDKVIVPGFIAQHDHPFLTALTMTSEIIAIEDWVLPSGTVPAAKDREDYLRRLEEADARLVDSHEPLVTWDFITTSSVS